jgi:hypothetical protein
LEVLNRLAKEFDTEWAVEGKTVHLSRRRTASRMEFRHGWNLGLYSIARQLLPDTKIYTRLYAEGSDKNLPSNYRGYKNRLKMLGGIDYVEESTDVYGVIEEAHVFDDIFPHRTGKVTAINEDDIYVFYDSTLTFDINQYLIAGVEPKITFNSGQLQGYTFKIQRYDATGKSFRILPNEEEKTLAVPSDLLKPAIDDEYVLTDIYLPQYYIDEAERQLTVAAQTMLSKAARPQYKYDIDISPTYMEGKGYTLTPGTDVKLIDEELGLNEKRTAMKVLRYLQTESKYSVELSEKQSLGKIAQLRQSNQQNSRAIDAIQRILNSLPIINNRINGSIQINDLPVYADDAAAGLGGLTKGKLYKTPAGEIRIKL